MDVTFRESEPFYGKTNDLSGFFKGLDHPGDAQEGRRLETMIFNRIKVMTSNNINKFILFRRFLEFLGDLNH
jgi:hypothetical protein